MRRTATVTALLLVALAVFAGTARAGDVARYHYNGITYTPATDATHSSPAGFVPTVTLPAGTPYYATPQPQTNDVRVFARNLKLVVWIPLDIALEHNWYTGHNDGLPTWAIVVILVGGTLLAGVGLGYLLDEARKRRV